MAPVDLEHEGALSDADVAAYRRDGFLFPLPVTDPGTAAAWRAEIEDVELRCTDALAARPFADYARANFHVVCAAAARLAHHRALLDPVESIIGPDIVCWMSELIIKEPHTTKILTMHQDLTYWGLDGADQLVTAWLALTDAMPANGGMQFVRGSHHAGQVAHHDTFGRDNLLSRGQEISVTYDPSDVADVILRPGEMSLHHGLMFHGSGPNTTDGRRIALVFRFVAPSVAQHVGATDYGMVVRGANRTSNLLSTPVPFEDFAPESLRLHDEITAAQATTLATGATQPLSYRRS